MAELKELRQAYCEAIMELCEQDPNVVILDADLMRSVGTLSIKDKLGKRAIDCGIAEANMVGIASGLSAQGFVPFASTFSCFAARRAFDQFFISANYARLNVKLVGTDPGVMAAFNGGTHMAFEDIGLMRMIPDVVIAEPSDCASVKGIVKAMYRHQGSCYLRLQRQAASDIYGSYENFELGRSKILCSGGDVTIIALGALMVHNAIIAAEKLKTEGIQATVIDALSVKPLDRELILSSVRRTGAVITCENHQTDGGLGMAVTKLLAEEGLCNRIGYIGIDDRFGQVGTVDFLAGEYNLKADDICAKVRSILK